MDLSNPGIKSVSLVSGLAKKHLSTFIKRTYLDPVVEPGQTVGLFEQLRRLFTLAEQRHPEEMHANDQQKQVSSRSLKESIQINFTLSKGPPNFRPTDFVPPVYHEVFALGSRQGKGL
jgi:hypothetical protein